MTEPTRRQLTIAAEPAAVDHAQDELAALWEEVPDVSDQDRMRFELGVVEILANIVEHAWAHDAHPTPRVVFVDLEATADRLSARLSDNGLPVGLDLSNVTMPDADAESGRGLAMTLAAVDSLEYERDGDRNIWKIACDRRAG